MTMQMKFSPEVIAIFNDERYSHPVPLVQCRMEALWLKSHNLPHAQIAQLVGICENTLRDYFKLYLDNGVDGLRTVQFHRPQSELCAYATSLEAHFREHPPATIKQAQFEIETLTGIKRSPTQVRTFLKKTLAEMSQDRNDASQGRPRKAGAVSKGNPTAATG
jgi:transposase